MVLECTGMLGRKARHHTGALRSMRWISSAWLLRMLIMPFCMPTARMDPSKVQATDKILEDTFSLITCFCSGVHNPKSS